MMHVLFIRLCGILIFIFMPKCVHCQLDVGYYCTDNSGKAGVCQLISNCPSAISAIQEQKNYPKTCGFQGAKPIVCCVDNDLDPPSTSIPTQSPTLSVGNKSRAKCKEYEQYGYVYPTSGNAPLSDCDVAIPLIVGRTNKARIKEFPHMALIGFDDDNNKTNWLCGGSLISDQFILTAAHCLSHREYGEPMYVRMGDIDTENDNDDAELQDFTIIEKFMHPDYKIPSFYNDIALLKLNRKARLNSYVRPACLETNPSVNFTNKPLATGWDIFSFSEPTSNLLLLKVELQYSTHDECDEVYKGNRGVRLKNGIDDSTQVCASKRYETELCTAEIGGPLQIRNKEPYCTYNIVGVSSFGRSCGTPNIPYVYTRVSNYIGWIEGIVWP